MPYLISESAFKRYTKSFGSVFPLPLFPVFYLKHLQSLLKCGKLAKGSSINPDACDTYDECLHAAHINVNNNKVIKIINIFLQKIK